MEDRGGRSRSGVAAAAGCYASREDGSTGFRRCGQPCITRPLGRKPSAHVTHVQGRSASFRSIASEGRPAGVGCSSAVANRRRFGECACLRRKGRVQWTPGGFLFELSLADEGGAEESPGEGLHFEVGARSRTGRSYAEESSARIERVLFEGPRRRETEASSAAAGLEDLPD